MTQSIILCRICRKPKQTNGKICLGCGTPVANAIDHSKPKNVKPRCPNPECRGGGVRELEPGRFCCEACSSVFEPDDGFALDDRPDENFDKRRRVERHARRRA